MNQIQTRDPADCGSRLVESPKLRSICKHACRALHRSHKRPNKSGHQCLHVLVETNHCLLPGVWYLQARVLPKIHKQGRHPSIGPGIVERERVEDVQVCLFGRHEGFLTKVAATLFFCLVVQGIQLDPESTGVDPVQRRKRALTNTRLLSCTKIKRHGSQRSKRLCGLQVSVPPKLLLTFLVDPCTLGQTPSCSSACTVTRGLNPGHSWLSSWCGRSSFFWSRCRDPEGRTNHGMRSSLWHNMTAHIVAAKTHPEQMQSVSRSSR